MKEIIKKKCFLVVLALFLTTCGLLWFSHGEVIKCKKMVEEVEYYDSLNRYNKIYYDKTFNALKKENRELYDSLKKYKDKVTFLIQFTHEKDYNTGVVTTKPKIKDSTVYDTIPVTIPLVARTYEYVSEPNDTFQYNLNVNSFTEPLWYSIKAKVKNKFTIVNKEDGDANHIVIDPGNGGNVTDVTVWKKKEKRTLWNRFSFGPGVTAGYDPIHKQWGVVVGATASFDLK